MKFISLIVVLIWLNISCRNVTAKEDKDIKTDSASLKTNNELAQVGNSSLELFGKYLFECVQENDYLMYSKFVPTKTEMVDFLRKSNDKEKSSATDQEIENGYKVILENIKKAFDNTVAVGNSKGINWSETSFIKSAYNSSNEDGVEFSRITVFFSFKGLTYSLEFSDNLKASRGWLTVSEVSFEEKKEEKQPVLEDSVSS